MTTLTDPVERFRLFPDNDYQHNLRELIETHGPLARA